MRSFSSSTAHSSFVSSTILHKSASYTSENFPNCFLLDNSSFSVTIVGAYLDDSLPDKPENFNQMKCCARLPIFDSTKIYREIDDSTLFGRVLTQIEFSAFAHSIDALKTSNSLSIYVN